MGALPQLEVCGPGKIELWVESLFGLTEVGVVVYHPTSLRTRDNQEELSET